MFPLPWSTFYFFSGLNFYGWFVKVFAIFWILFFDSFANNFFQLLACGFILLNVSLMIINSRYKLWCIFQSFRLCSELCFKILVKSFCAMRVKFILLHHLTNILEFCFLHVGLSGTEFCMWCESWSYFIFSICKTNLLNSQSFSHWSAKANVKLLHVN